MAHIPLRIACQHFIHTDRARFHGSLSGPRGRAHTKINACCRRWATRCSALALAPLQGLTTPQARERSHMWCYSFWRTAAQTPTPPASKRHGVAKLVCRRPRGAALASARRGGSLPEARATRIPRPMRQMIDVVDPTTVIRVSSIAVSRCCVAGTVRFLALCHTHARGAWPQPRRGAHAR